MSRPLLVVVLSVEFTALLLLTSGFLSQLDVPATQVRDFAVVTLLGLFFNEMAHDVAGVRRRTDGELHVDLCSVWTLAGAVLLPPAWAALSAVVVHSHLWYRPIHIRGPRYRHTFSTAVTALSCMAASAVMSWIGASVPVAPIADFSFLTIVAGVVAFTTVNTALVAVVIAIHTPGARVATLVGDRDQNLLEVATLCLGGLAAALIVINPWLVLFLSLPLLVLYRAVLVRQLTLTAAIDDKTGLLTAAAWRLRAERELRRKGPRAVLAIDLDHFKAVNDTHGHLAGDRVLAAVADAVQGEVRDRDLVGRFGGEEFVVLLGGLGDPGHAELVAVAEQIRRRIASLRVETPTADGPLTVAGLSASVGAALHPGDGRDLRTLLQVADAALYAAKRAGRNRVRMGLQPEAVERRSVGH